ncbi:MAG: formate dehydrogenase accessory protein FdhE [Selenomonas sp.]|uniref:formate dehydrogenase accessory protein FdhE n=1 Tax=Selenomonas sp. TaxID=2053611 RepID=UPI0025F35C86|nr:formate dehydrogenase accessory protein FdhE [Selenomonas sp.]MCR5757271.1 formate dehydrogenase accessory protein FdhE [Selenomonas sp.]
MKPVKKSPLDEYLQKHPFLEETAQLHLAMETILKNEITPVSFPAVGEIIKLVKDGVSLLQQESLQVQVARAAASGLADWLLALKGMPAPEPMLSAVRDWHVRTEVAAVVDREKFFFSLLRQDEKEIAQYAAEQQVNAAVVRILGWQIIDLLIPAAVKDVSLWQAAGWMRNYCPVCGRQPVMAQLRKEQEGRARVLTCDGCHTIWPYVRIGCVYCGNEDLKQMHVLEPEGEADMRLDVCDLCHNYLKTYVAEGAEEVYLQDWATLHLDFLGEEKNLRKKGSVILADS